jgi:transposase, IS5 family
LGTRSDLALHRLLASARQEKVETGKVVRLDSTVTAALLHEPSDSSLLWDAVRVMVRLVKAADALIGGRSRLAQSSARGEDAGARDRVCSRSTDPGPALS